MRFLIGTTGICLAVLYFCFVLLVSRKEKQPWWMNDTMVANVHCVLIISFLMIGLLTLITALPTLARGLVGKTEVLSAILIAAATIVGVKIMRIPKRMKEHRERAARIGFPIIERTIENKEADRKSVV